MKIVFLFSYTHTLVDYKRKNTRAVHIVIQKSQMERKNKKAVKKNVQFSHLVTIHTLDDAEEDRRSEWMRHAIDRRHFKRRITCLAPIVERVLTIEHRQKIRQR